MIVLQYYPYEGGNGKVFWVKNSDGIEIPVVTAKFALWANLDNERAGTPTRLARIVNETAENARANGELLQAWSVVHAWSGFKNTGDEQTENSTYGDPNSSAGVTPIGWCAQKLSDDIKVVNPEELLWRIRMRHDPQQTTRAIELLNQ